ncbi:helix-turn-helix domain-containing protein [Halovivax sp.]|uniref:helix-turn-helix domain-containing protein n=1 Tax=Halovivax sp. TaxID=1935978 RepID=UPI0025C5039E|nr:helix-turn-helix domain-containing protein [Halovivax sp.]
MSVILEFTIENDEFTLGEVLSGSPPMHIDLERIVPTGNSVVPFLWVTGDEFEAFERTVTAHEFVDEILALDKMEDSTLYRVRWHGRHNDLIQGITEADGTILEGHADDRWYFRLRFPDHDALSRFHNFCTDLGITIHIVRTYTETDRTESVKQFGLSQEQREALVVGLRRGYFDTPSQASLDELADELGISQQATSNRIRRGTKQVLSEALLSSAMDLE